MNRGFGSLGRFLWPIPHSAVLSTTYPREFVHTDWRSLEFDLELYGCDAGEEVELALYEVGPDGRSRAFLRTEMASAIEKARKVPRNCALDGATDLFLRMQSLPPRGVFELEARLCGGVAVSNALRFETGALPIDAAVASFTDVIGIYLGHDGGIAVVSNGEPLALLELERVSNIRYHWGSSGMPESEGLRMGIDAVTKLTQRHSFYAGVWVHYPGAYSDWSPYLAALLLDSVPVGRVYAVDHQPAHAAIGFFDSPFESALVVSYDGGGNEPDGAFYPYMATRRDGLGQRLAGPYSGINLGFTYQALGQFVPATYSPVVLATAGKLMAYAALGSVRSQWLQPVKDIFRKFMMPQALLLRRLLMELPQPPELSTKDNAEGWIASDADARDFAATVEAAFEEVSEVLVRAHVDKIRPAALVLSGGCALNILTNERLRRAFALPVYVSPAPNDSGLAMGAAWLVSPPQRLRAAAEPSALTFSGAAAWDLDALPSLLSELGAREVDSIEFLCDLVLSGKVVGVMRGRQEVGPRALGHRSLLAYPSTRDVIVKMNKIKFRQSYRPVAPIVAEEDVRRVFGESVESPYMSFAPRVAPEALAALPAMAHVDGTARVQTVRMVDEPWLHRLLLELRRRTGWGVLANTSFNVRGEPLINKYSTAVRIFAESEDVEGLLLESSSVTKASAVAFASRRH